MNPILLSSLALFLVGCAGPEALRDIQLASLRRFDEPVIKQPISLGSETEPRLFKSSIYLKLHSAAIVNAPTEDAVPHVQSVPKKHGGNGLQVVWKSDSASRYLEKHYAGSASPITADGYFLTAYHVVEDETSWIWTEEITTRLGSDGKYHNFTNHLLGRVRVVFADREHDFAIIKAPYPIKHYLRFRESKLEKGELLFGGGPWHETSAGLYNGEYPQPSSNPLNPHRFRRIDSSVPLLKGDSGSPLVDKDGLLCGINYLGVKGAFIRLWRFSSATMTDSLAIMAIIESDRKANATVAGGSR